MQKTIAAVSPDTYVTALSGWQRDCVERLRATVRTVEGFDEVVKWRNIVYLAHGPAIVIRAENERVLLGFWRGQRLRSIAPDLKVGGKYEMATLELRQGMTVDEEMVRTLAANAMSLNQTLGDPTKTP